MENSDKSSQPSVEDSDKVSEPSADDPNVTKLEDAPKAILKENTAVEIVVNTSEQEDPQEGSSKEKPGFDEVPSTSVSMEVDLSSELSSAQGDGQEVEDQKSFEEVRAQHWFNTKSLDRVEPNVEDEQIGNPADSSLGETQSLMVNNSNGGSSNGASGSAQTSHMDDVVWKAKPLENIEAPESFTSFMFWRDPLPIVDPDEDLALEEPPAKHGMPLGLSDIQLLSEKLHQMHAEQQGEVTASQAIPNLPELLTTDLDAEPDDFLEEPDDLDLLEEHGSFMDLMKATTTGK